jgi:hypothetical protein
MSPPIQKEISLLKNLPQLIKRNVKAWRKMSVVVVILKTILFTVLHNMFKSLPINCHVMNKTWTVVIFIIKKKATEEKEMCHPRGRWCSQGRKACPTANYVNRKIIF